MQAKIKAGTPQEVEKTLSGAYKMVRLPAHPMHTVTPAYISVAELAV